MNQLVFCVTPSARASSCDETLFLLFASNHTAGSHLSQPRGESSKMVPTLAENWRRHSLLRHFQMRRVETNECSVLPQ